MQRSMVSMGKQTVSSAYNYMLRCELDHRGGKSRVKCLSILRAYRVLPRVRTPEASWSWLSVRLRGQYSWVKLAVDVEASTYNHLDGVTLSLDTQVHPYGVYTRALGTYSLYVSTTLGLHSTTYVLYTPMHIHTYSTYVHVHTYAKYYVLIHTYILHTYNIVLHTY